MDQEERTMANQTTRPLLAIVLVQALFSAPASGITTTISGSLGDLDGNADGGAGENAMVQAATQCWDTRITTARNFTLTVSGASLTGGTLGTGATSAVDGGNTPTAGFINIDNDGSTTWFVDGTPLDSLEFNPDPVSQWRFINGPIGSDLFSTVHHEVGHALGWLCGSACGFNNPDYDALMVPTTGSFVSNSSCTAPFPLAGQPPLPGCVHLTSNPFDVSLRGDGLGGSGSSVVNELSHPGIRNDLMEGFSGSGQRETPSVTAVQLFQSAFNDSVNLPLTVDAGADIVAECSAIGGADVTLDASGSTDPENDALTYAWSCDGGVVLTDPTSQMPDGFFPLDQTTNCRLDATDQPLCAPDADTVEVRVEDTIAPEIVCPEDISVECAATGGTGATDPAIVAFLDGATASDVCDATLDITNDAPGFFNLGTTTVNFDTVDDSGNLAMCAADVNVVDTTPPEIESVSTNPMSLWPPNHKMRPVTVAIEVSDICDPDVTCNVVSVASDEPVNGQGDGNTEPDWEITGALSVNLRAERSGGGDGRVYTIGVECSDASGNTSAAEVDVFVPHDQSPGSAQTQSFRLIDAEESGAGESDSETGEVPILVEETARERRARLRAERRARRAALRAERQARREAARAERKAAIEARRAAREAARLDAAAQNGQG